MNIVFMGTPEFAVNTLGSIYSAGHNVMAVFTQPDKVQGRGYKLTPPPVKVCALTHDTPVYQPQSLKKAEVADEYIKILKELNPDFIVVVAYGKILPKVVLDIPKKACINVHASLLPKYRGAGPIQWSVLNGEEETGVTTMLMAEGIDTGDMLLKSKIKIGENETASELHDRLAVLGAELLLKTIETFDSIVPEKQNDNESCHASMLTKDMCPIKFENTAQEVHNQIRGLSDWPCATALLDGKRIKIYKSEIVSVLDEHEIPGAILDEKNLIVACKKGSIKITELQAEGSKRMKAADYLRGKPVGKNSIFQ